MAPPSGPPLPPPAHDAPLPSNHLGADNVRVLPGIAYAEIPGIRPLELDLYLPPEPTGPVPVVVFFHGGGWRLGSRGSAGPAFAGARRGPFERVAAAGIAVASADYRLSGEAVWPAQLHDAKAAVRWLRARADEAGLDPERIAVWGESAGGHLAALVGLTGTDPGGAVGLTGSDLDGAVGLTGPPATVSAVAAWYAPSDLIALPGDQGADPMNPDTREAQLIGGPVGVMADRAREASPIDYVHADAPPFLLRHGRADRLIPCIQTERFASALFNAGVEVDVEFVSGADHMWIGACDAAEQVLTETIKFLRHQLKRDHGSCAESGREDQRRGDHEGLTAPDPVRDLGGDGGEDHGNAGEHMLKIVV